MLIPWGPPVKLLVKESAPSFPHSLWPIQVHVQSLIVPDVIESHVLTSLLYICFETVLIVNIVRIKSFFPSDGETFSVCGQRIKLLEVTFDPFRINRAIMSHYTSNSFTRCPNKLAIFQNNQFIYLYIYIYRYIDISIDIYISIYICLHSP